MTGFALFLHQPFSASNRQKQTSDQTDKHTLPVRRVPQFGRVESAAPKKFLDAFAPIQQDTFQAMEKHLKERESKNESIEDIRAQIPPHRDDAPALEIKTCPEPLAKGLFATRDFHKGEPVIRFDTQDTKDNTPAFNLAPLKQLHANDSVINLGHYVVVSDEKALTWAKPQKISYLNHGKENGKAGEDANVEVSYDKKAYVALRPIKKGEMVCSDYDNGEYRTAEDKKAFNTRHPFLANA